MRQGFVHIAFIAGAALMLSACGLADSRAPVPAFMRAKESDPPPLEPPPDVKRLVHDHLDSVFISNSDPRAVRVSPPHHDPVGTSWSACVRAELTNAIGKPLGTETYRITIADGVIIDRKRIDADDNCVTESYEPI